MGHKEEILLGRWSDIELDNIIRESSTIRDMGERIGFLSSQFLGVAYQESTLTRDRNPPEVFVINLGGVDCFTLIDYVEAMRLAGSFSEFKKNLKRVRYQGGTVAFEKRNHFFTDWAEYNPEFVEDVTAKIGGGGTMRVSKRLNLKKDGTDIIPGIGYREREIRYLPPSTLNDSIMDRLKTGDYAGIYSDEDGLDVSHVGIAIKRGDRIHLRHASSRPDQRRVIDEEFRGYIAGKPGLVVLRPKPIESPAHAP